MKLHLCKCGCGEEVTKKSNLYIWGHNAKGRKVSEKQKEKQSKRLKGKNYIELHGEEKSEEIKQKIGAKSKGRIPINKGQTWNEFYGENKADQMREKTRKKLTNHPKLKDRCGPKNPNYKGSKDSLYNHWSPKLIFDENRNNNNKIEVKCTYCGKWFTPSESELNNRINAIKREKFSCDFYCSNECKHLCSSHYQVLWPKNHKPYDNKYTQIEVSPELRKMVFERDNWECQKCGYIKSLECHHIDPVSQIPMFVNDVSSCITLCSKCHKFVHTEIEWCKYHELKKKKENC